MLCMDYESEIKIYYYYIIIIIIKTNISREGRHRKHSRTRAARNALILVRQLHCDVTCSRFELRVKLFKQKEHQKLLPTSNFVN